MLKNHSEHGVNKLRKFKCHISKIKVQINVVFVLQTKEVILNCLKRVFSNSSLTLCTKLCSVVKMFIMPAYVFTGCRRTTSTLTLIHWSCSWGVEECGSCCWHAEKTQRTRFLIINLRITVYQDLRKIWSRNSDMVDVWCLLPNNQIRVNQSQQTGPCDQHLS